MVRTMVVLAVLVAFSGVAAAQERADYEVFGGYSFVRQDSIITDFSHPILNGWDASVTRYLTKNLGVEFDLGGQYGHAENRSGFTEIPGFIVRPGEIKLKSKLFTFMAGPHVAADHGPVRPFAHALVGGTKWTYESEQVPISRVSETKISAAFGGGLDVPLTKSFSVRAGQVDYLLTTFGSEHQNNLRFSAGVVFSFGH